MRYIVKMEEDKTDKLKSKETYQKLKDIVIRKIKDNIDDKIYRDAYDTPDGRRSKVEDQLAISYKNKCAYCERICKADVEHYRPKKSVTGEVHDGYYWLCYEWSNLIPSCITCNREGAKHNLFPIKGIRVTTPSFLVNGELDLDKFKSSSKPLIDELPYLIHPEVDIPEKFFEFEIDSGNKGIRIIGIDTDGRGKATIEICKLNRQELKLDRKVNVIDDFVEAVRGLFAKLEIGSITDDQLIETLILFISHVSNSSKIPEKTHTLLRKWIIKSPSNFEKIVLPFLNENQRKIVGEAFKIFIDG
jgi:uncharacterized protein (TIGR02646 family)